LVVPARWCRPFGPTTTAPTLNEHIREEKVLVSEHLSLERLEREAFLFYVVFLLDLVFIVFLSLLIIHALIHGLAM